MENLNKCRLNYSSNNRNYNAYQMILPLDLSKKIEEDDPVRSFLEVMEGANWNKYLKVQTNKGREEYNPFKMIKIVLFAFMNQIYTLRGIEKACKTDIRFMYLMGEEKPSHMAIQRFITKYLKDSIENVFKDIFESICLLDDINKDVVYVDGTKIEANANKFTFIWKKTAVKTRDKTFVRLNNLVEKVKDWIETDKKEQWSPDEVEKIINQLKVIMEKEKVVFVYGKGRRKTAIQRIYDDFRKLKDTLENCLERINLCGPDRCYCQVKNGPRLRPKNGPLLAKPFFCFFNSVTITGHIQNMRFVSKPIHHCACKYRIFKNFNPSVKNKICRNNYRFTVASI
jgi:transposase